MQEFAIRAPCQQKCWWLWWIWSPGWHQRSRGHPSTTWKLRIRTTSELRGQSLAIQSLSRLTLNACAYASSPPCWVSRPWKWTVCTRTHNTSQYHQQYRMSISPKCLVKCKIYRIIQGPNYLFKNSAKAKKQGWQQWHTFGVRAPSPPPKNCHNYMQRQISFMANSSYVWLKM